MLRGLLALIVAAAAGLALAGPALAAGAVAPAGDVPASAPARVVIDTVRADLRIDRDGSLHVVETQRYHFGSDPVEDVRRSIQTRARFDESYDQVFTVTGVRAALDGRTVRVTRSEAGNQVDLAVAFGRGVTGRHTVRLEYDVDGAVRRTPDGLELSWPLVQGLGVPVASAEASLAAPRVLWAACFAGGIRSTMPCTATQVGEAATPAFVQDGLAPGERMTIVAGMPADAGVEPSQTLDRRWSLARAFSLTPLTVGLLLGLVLLAGLAVLALWWTRGRDTAAAAADGEAYDPLLSGPDGAVRFEPPDGIRPGQLGTVVDERANVVDIVATVLDLAVRGVVVVEELPRSSPHRRPDWALHRAGGTEHADHENPAGDDADREDADRDAAAGEGPDGPGRGELAPYERVVMDLLFGAERQRGAVTLTALAETFPEGLPRVQDQLYADVHTRGWFRQRPDAVRSRWTAAGGALALAGVVLTAVLAAFTDLGLVGVGVVLAGAILAWGGDVAPARTARGSALLRRLRRFRAYLGSADGSELPESARAEMVARILPYAVVFGLDERWARIFAASGRPGDPDAGLGWYRAPDDWHRVDLPDSLEAFVTTLSGAISASRRLRV